MVGKIYYFQHSKHHVNCRTLWQLQPYALCLPQEYCYLFRHVVAYPLVFMLAYTMCVQLVYPVLYCQ